MLAITVFLLNELRDLDVRIRVGSVVLILKTDPIDIVYDYMQVLRSMLSFIASSAFCFLAWKKFIERCHG